MIEWNEENKSALIRLLNEEFMFLKNGVIVRRDEMRDDLKERVFSEAIVIKPKID